MKKDIVVFVHREGNGRLVSELWDKSRDTNYVRKYIVIDRPDQRGPIDNDGLIHRAKMISKMLGIPYEENMEWECQATKKLRCLCPECIKKGKS